MPVKKTITRKTTAGNKTDPAKTRKSFIPGSLITPKNLIIVGLLVLAIAFWFLKNYFIVATVNGQPVSRFELNTRLNSQFRSSVVDQLINERLLLGAVRQQGIFITTTEIDQRVKEIEKSLEGKMTLDAALKTQGLSSASFRRQLELQLSIEKMFAKDATVSASEIDEYLKNNQSLFPEATDTAKLKSEVEGFIKQQKISKLYEDWFNKIKQDAKISRNIE